MMGFGHNLPNARQAIAIIGKRCFWLKAEIAILQMGVVLLNIGRITDDHIKCGFISIGYCVILIALQKLDQMVKPQSFGVLARKFNRISRLINPQNAQIDRRFTDGAFMGNR